MRYCLPQALHSMVTCGAAASRLGGAGVPTGIIPLQAGHRINLRSDDACFSGILYRFWHSGQLTIINGTPLVVQDLTASSTG
jgi:hypothetical protein